MTKRIRKPFFGPRSALPPGAACVVANGFRETLTSLLGTPVVLRLFEPSIPPSSAWAAIVSGALLYRVRGNVADAVVVLRPCHALALAAALFGERADAHADRALSPVELEVLERTITSLAAHLSTVCGTRESHPTERVGAIEGFTTYFELSVEEPVSARIGVALSRDPSPEPRGHVGIGHLSGVPIAAHVRLDLGHCSGGAIGALGAGTILPVRSEDLNSCVLLTHGRKLARGSFGLIRGRPALRVEAVCETM